MLKPIFQSRPSGRFCRVSKFNFNRWQNNHNKNAVYLIISPAVLLAATGAFCSRRQYKNALMHLLTAELCKTMTKKKEKSRKMLFNLAKSFDSALLLSHCCYSIMCKSKYFCYLYISENDTPDNLQNVAPSDGERLWRKVVQAPKVSPAAGGAPTAVADRETGRRGVTRHKAGVAGGSRAVWS